MAKKISRKYLTLSVLLLLAVALALAFRPQPLAVDIGNVERGSMLVTIDEEGRTRVRDGYMVSTPVAGQLLRVDVEPGDRVIAGKSIVAVMLPAKPTPLDARSRAQADAEVAAAEAALRLVHAERSQAAADQKLAETELKRTRSLRESNLESQSALDRAIRQALIAEAALTSAEAAITERQANLASARARLMEIDGQTSVDSDLTKAINLYAPSNGQVLRVMQESEATLAAGTAVLEIGNIDNDLEVVVELLSSDAVQVAPGDKVVFSAWGGQENLNGVVTRVDPWGFTKVSALGVEEQRVNAIIRFTGPQESRRKLGHGFRVEAQIIVWQEEDALLVPSSALFRDGRQWSVFVVATGTATVRKVEIGKNNGFTAQVLKGLEAGEHVVLYPAAELTDGVKVSQRKIDR
jgi:HlyD family secretion protein